MIFMVWVRTPVHARFYQAVEIIIYNILGGYAPATVASPRMISVENRGNLNTR